MSIEETDRDWHTGWGVRAAAVALPSEAMVERLLGVVGLTSLLQRQLGQRVRADPVGRRRRVTDRVSLVLVRPAAVPRSGLRLGPLAGPAVGDARHTTTACGATTAA